MIPLDKHTQPRTAASRLNFNLTQLKFESANSSDSDSNMVWIILFSLVIFISILSNSLYIFSNLKRRCLTHTLLSVFFLINLLDYVLLVLEFSFDQSGQFSYSDSLCSLYQLLVEASPLLTAATLVFLVYQAWGLGWLASISSWTTVIGSTLTLITFMLMLMPSVFFSEIAVYPSTATYCVIDLSGLANKMGLDVNTQHIVTALYFILYKSVLAYWLPLLLTAIPLVKTLKNINFSDEKYSSQSLSLTVVISFFVFHLPLATLHLTRYSLGQEQGQAWTVQVLHSLFLLLSFFFHIFRPVACLVLSSDGRQTVKTGGYHQVDSQAQLAA